MHQETQGAWHPPTWRRCFVVSQNHRCLFCPPGWSVQNKIHTEMYVLCKYYFFVRKNTKCLNSIVSSLSCDVKEIQAMFWGYAIWYSCKTGQVFFNGYQWSTKTVFSRDQFSVTLKWTVQTMVCTYAMVHAILPFCFWLHSSPTTFIIHKSMIQDNPRTTPYSLTTRPPLTCPLNNKPQRCAIPV